MNNLVSYESEDSDNEISNSESNTNSIKGSNKTNLESEWAFFEQMINDPSTIPTPSSTSTISYPTVKPTYSTMYPTNCLKTISNPSLSPDYSKASFSQPSSPNNLEASNTNDIDLDSDKVADLLDLYYNKWNKMDDENKNKDSNKNINLPLKSDSSSDSDTNIWKYDLGETNIKEAANQKEKSVIAKESTRAKFKEERSDDAISRSGKSVSSHSSVSTSSSSEDEASSKAKRNIAAIDAITPVMDSTTVRLQQMANESVNHSRKKSNEEGKVVEDVSKRHPLKRSNRSRSRSRSAKRQHKNVYLKITDDQKNIRHSHLNDKKSSPRRHVSRDRDTHRRKEDRRDRRSSRERKTERLNERERHRGSSRDRKSSERKSHKRSHRSRSKSRDGSRKDETFKDRVKAQMAAPVSTTQTPTLSQEQIQLHKDLMMMSKNFNLKGMMPLNSKMAMSAFLAKCTRDKITPQEALMQSMKAMQAKAEAITGVAVPQYYNPTAINPIRYAEQIKKRKMLWSKNKEKEVEEEITPEAKEVQWSSTSFESDCDGKVAAKFRKLMGIKEEAQQQLANIDLSKLSEEQRQKQQELFENLDREYNFARMTTHTCRGVGLGFTSQQFFPE